MTYIPVIGATMTFALPFFFKSRDRRYRDNLRRISEDSSRSVTARRRALDSEYLRRLKELLR